MKVRRIEPFYAPEYAVISHRILISIMTIRLVFDLTSWLRDSKSNFCGQTGLPLYVGILEYSDAILLTLELLPTILSRKFHSSFLLVKTFLKGKIPDVSRHLYLFVSELPWSHILMRLS